MRQRHILEVDTPALGHYMASDPYVHSLRAQSTFLGKDYYLHTSPEFCMKRLLAAGSGSIYQIAHVFRDEECGRQHLSEFSMLEWYRVGLDYYQLMDEVTELLEALDLQSPDRLTYAEAFKRVLGIDPHTETLQRLMEIARKNGLDGALSDRRPLLDFIFSTQVLPALESAGTFIIYDYPVCMAALATIKAGAVPVGERFELFINGIEIANGFNELCDGAEQRERFKNDLDKRRELNKTVSGLDTYFLAAISAGLPKSAGVAVGLDRLLMILAKTRDIHEVCSFTLENN